MTAVPQDAPGWWGRPAAEFRWTLELGRLLADPVMRGVDVPRGDGRAVLLMPGLLVSDQTLAVMARWLRTIGYAPGTVGFLTNTDCGDRAMQRVERRAERMAEQTGRRIAAVGHSRGGHFARALARRRPDLVSHAVSLGAGLNPTLAISKPTLAAVNGARAVSLATRRARDPRCMTEACGCSYGRDLREPFPFDRVRLTSIYSKGDGVVRWWASILDGAECIEVTGSHVGLAFNRKVYRQLARVLATDELPSA